MIKITVTENERQCEMEGNFADICGEAIFAIRSMIECIEDINPEAAQQFSKMLPKICAVARLSPNEASDFSDMLRVLKKVNELLQEVKNA